MCLLCHTFTDSWESKLMLNSEQNRNIFQCRTLCPNLSIHLLYFISFWSDETILSLLKFVKKVLQYNLNIGVSIRGSDNWNFEHLWGKTNHFKVSQRVIFNLLILTLINPIWEGVSQGLYSENCRKIFPWSCKWASETLYTIEPFLPWLKDLLGAAAP